MAIYLGRDAVVTWGGVIVPGVRDVQISYTAKTKEITPFGSRHAFVYHLGYNVSLTLETIDDAAATTATNAIVSGAEIAVVTYGHSFTAVVVGISDAMPLDDVRAWSIQMEKTQPGLRS